MIISLRGTNGSGKSSLVREIMTLYHTEVKIEYRGRRRPVGYVMLPRDFSETRLFVPGHYEIANGGMDTLPSLEYAYDLIRVHALELGSHVLYEGKNMSDGTQNLLDLRDQGLDVAVALIDEPLETCVASVRARGHRIKVETIEKLHRRSHAQMAIFERENVECFTGSRAQTLEQVKRWLKL